MTAARDEPLTLDRYFAAWRVQIVKFLRAKYRLDNGPMDDIMAIVDEKVWLGLGAGRFQQGSNERNWLITLACNAATDWFRSQNRLKREVAFNPAFLGLDEDDDGLLNTRADPGPGPEQIALDSEALGEMLALMNRIPAACAEAVLIRAVLELPYDELAIRQGITISHAYGRVQHARRRLKHFAQQIGPRAA